MPTGPCILFDRCNADTESPSFNWSPPPAVLPILSKNIHLWKLDLSTPSTSQLNDLAATLSDDERERVRRFQFDLHRQRYIAKRGGLRRIMACYLNVHPTSVRFEYGPCGKPFLTGHTAPHFNVTASDDLAVVAVCSDWPVGIDVERVDRSVDHMAIAMNMFTPDEVRALSISSPSSRAQTFMRLWTRHEAILKTSGLGLSRSKCNPDIELTEPLYRIREFTPHTGFIAAFAFSMISHK